MDIDKVSNKVFKVLFSILGIMLVTLLLMFLGIIMVNTVNEYIL